MRKMFFCLVISKDIHFVVSDENITDNKQLQLVVVVIKSTCQIYCYYYPSELILQYNFCIVLKCRSIGTFIWLTAKLNLFTTEDAAHSSWEG